jgi:hypothetical protein
MSDTPTQRYVPGAPPPVLASKTSKKKRKVGKGSRSEDSPALSSVAIPDSTSATLEKTPDAPDVKDGPVPDGLPADPHGSNGIPSGQSPFDEAKHSPIVDLIQKRVKSTNKKIVRPSRTYEYTAANTKPFYRLEYTAMKHLVMQN